MKRLIAALGVGWGLIYATNHLLLPRAPTESKVAVQSEQTSTNRSINSWGPYLSDVKPEPNNMAQTSLKSRQTQEPAASEAELMPSSSRDIIDHAEAVALEERTLRVARVENPPTSAVRQHDGSPSSLQDLKPNSEAVALEERTLRVARVENPPTSAVRQHDGSPSSFRTLNPTQKPSRWKSGPYELLAWKTLQRPPYASTMASHHPYRTLNPTQKPSRWKSAPYKLLA